MFQTDKWKIVRFIVFGVGVMLMLGLGVVYSPYVLGSIRQKRLENLITSLPEPPGVVPDSIWMAASWYSTRATKRYIVDLPYDKTFDFFKQELLELDWQLLSEEETQGTLHKDMLLENRSHYCLDVSILVSKTYKAVAPDYEQASVWMRVEKRKPCGIE